MLLFSVLVVALLITATLYLMRSQSVLYRSSVLPDGTGEPSFLVLNPLRDRSPERSGEAFLESLRSGRCAETVGNLLSEEQRRYVCAKESEHVLETWRLKNREDLTEKTKLFFWHWRKDYDGLHERLWITVQKVNDQWCVTDYECWY